MRCAVVLEFDDWDAMVSRRVKLMNYIATSPIPMPGASV